MKPVVRSELLELETYETVRDETRARVIALKDARRVSLGSNMTLLFENRETIRYQVQEMLRVERITDEAAIAHELVTYNELLPGRDELSATLLIEYVTPEERDVKLRELIGLEKQGISLVVGKAGSFEAAFDERQLSERRISSVHYVRFRLGDAARAFKREGLGGGVKFVASHKAYEAQAILLPKQVEALARDLEAE